MSNLDIELIDVLLIAISVLGLILSFGIAYTQLNMARKYEKMILNKTFDDLSDAEKGLKKAQKKR
jgi:hypothetical protein